MTQYLSEARVRRMFLATYRLVFGNCRVIVSFPEAHCFVVRKTNFDGTMRNVAVFISDKSMTKDWESIFDIPKSGRRAAGYWPGFRKHLKNIVAGSDSIQDIFLMDAYVFNVDRIREEFTRILRHCEERSLPVKPFLFLALIGLLAHELRHELQWRGNSCGTFEWDRNIPDDSLYWMTASEIAEYVASSYGARDLSDKECAELLLRERDAYLTQQRVAEALMDFGQYRSLGWVRRCIQQAMLAK